MTRAEVPPLRRIFGGFLGEVREASCATQLGRAFLGLAGGFGYERILVLDATKLDRPLRKALVFTGGPIAKLADFADKNGYAAHPLIREALVRDGPVVGEDVRRREGIGEEAWAASLPPEGRHGTTLTLPVHRAGRCVLVIGCNGHEAAASPVARAVLHTAAHIFYDRLESLAATPAPHAALSSREAECVRWLSQGKTGTEIAAITGISARTVRYHLHNVKQKLGVGSTLEALRKLSALARA